MSKWDLQGNASLDSTVTSPADIVRFNLAIGDPTYLHFSRDLSYVYVSGIF